MADRNGVSSGSSPLTRGKLVDCRNRRRPRRLIPAHAGKTGNSSHSHHPRWAHPRSRGENSQRIDITQPCVGSSPLTRGKPRGGVRSDSVGGLIPAHAGKTLPAAYRQPASAAHPRSRGENEKWPMSENRPAGSSPLTRGKQALPCRARAATGLIPAHAGKTTPRALDRYGSAAHPRSRGENCAHIPRGLRTWGSSPLTRGKPQ